MGELVGERGRVVGVERHAEVRNPNRVAHAWRGELPGFACWQVGFLCDPCDGETACAACHVSHIWSRRCGWKACRHTYGVQSLALGGWPPRVGCECSCLPAWTRHSCSCGRSCLCTATVCLMTPSASSAVSVYWPNFGVTYHPFLLLQKGAR